MSTPTGFYMSYAEREMKQSLSFTHLVSPIQLLAASCPKLKRLSIEHSFLSVQEWSRLPSLTCLEDISIVRSDQLNRDTCKSIFRGLGHQLKSFHYIAFNETWNFGHSRWFFPIEMPCSVVPPFSAKLLIYPHIHLCASITSLTLDTCDIPVENLAILLNSLCPTLAHLAIENCSETSWFGDSYVKPERAGLPLASNLFTAPNLRSLSVENNFPPAREPQLSFQCFLNPSIRSFSHSNLESLHLWNNLNLDNFEFLESLHSLKQLTLGCLTNITAGALVRVSESCPLEAVCLRDIPGIKRFLLQNKFSLKRITIPGEFKLQTEDHLRQILRHNQRLEVFHVNILVVKAWNLGRVRRSPLEARGPHLTNFSIEHCSSLTSDILLRWIRFLPPVRQTRTSKTLLTVQVGPWFWNSDMDGQMRGRANEPNKVTAAAKSHKPQCLMTTRKLILAKLNEEGERHRVRVIVEHNLQLGLRKNYKEMVSC
jgi:hypothetical protein